MSYLTMIQNACLRIGLNKPDFIINSGDYNIQMLAGFVQQTGHELAQRHIWQNLIKPCQIEAINQFPLPEDCLKILASSFVCESRPHQTLSPISRQEWIAFKQKTIAGYRIQRNQVLLSGSGIKPEQYSFEYLSKNWVVPDQNEMIADSDQARLDEELITLGVIWRYLKAKGLDYGEAFQSYEHYLINAIARDGTQKTIRFSEKPIYSPIPEGNWKHTF